MVSHGVECNTFRESTGPALLWEPGKTYMKGRLNPRKQGKAWTSNFLQFAMMLKKTQQEPECSGPHWQRGWAEAGENLHLYTYIFQKPKQFCFLGLCRQDVEMFSSYLFTHSSTYFTNTNYASFMHWAGYRVMGSYNMFPLCQQLHSITWGRQPQTNNRFGRQFFICSSKSLVS